MNQKPKPIVITLVAAVFLAVVGLSFLLTQRKATPIEPNDATSQQPQGNFGRNQQPSSDDKIAQAVAGNHEPVSADSKTTDGAALVSSPKPVPRPPVKAAGSAASAAPGELPPEIAKNVAELQRILQSNSDTDIKELAAEALARLGTESAARVLIDAIRNATGVYRENLLHELRNITNSAAAPALAETLRDLQDMTLHRESRLVLLNMQSPASAEAVVAAATGVTNEQQRLALAFTLSMMTSQDAIPALVQAGRGQDELLATRSFMGLAHIGGTNALAALVQLATLPANQTGERGEELLTAISRATLTTTPTR